MNPFAQAKTKSRSTSPFVKAGKSKQFGSVGNAAGGYPQTPAPNPPAERVRNPFARTRGDKVRTAIGLLLGGDPNIAQAAQSRRENERFAHVFNDDQKQAIDFAQESGRFDVVEQAQAQQRAEQRAQQLQASGWTPQQIAQFQLTGDAPKTSAQDRRIVKGADGFQYFADDGSRVLPNAQAADSDNWEVIYGENGAYRVNAETGEVADLGIGHKPRSSGITVNTGNQGPVQTEPTAFEKKRDEMFAQTYIDWTSGGGADSAAQLDKIRDIVARIDRGDNLTGLDVGLQPRVMRAFSNPNSLDAQEIVEEVVQRNLRLVLGAQFTEKEGERLISRAYNPKLPEAQNRQRLVRLLDQMSAAGQQTQAMVNHVQQYGSLDGFEGQVPRIQQFYDALEREEGGQNTPQAFEGQARIPDSAANHLIANPNLADQFDDKYGAGASQRILGGR